MPVKKTFERLDNILLKSKPFLNHLVKSYFPADKIKPILENGKVVVCSITNKKLTVDVNLLNQIDSDFKTYLEGITYESIESNNIGNIVLTGKNTDTCMSLSTLLAFYSWVFIKSVSDDRHINWLLNSLVENPFKETRRKPKVQVSTFTIGDVDGFKEIREKFKK